MPQPQADCGARRRPPLARDSGTLRGKRLVWGGRAPVRASLYMGALGPDPSQSGHPRLLSPAGRGRQTEETRAHGLYEESSSRFLTR